MRLIGQVIMVSVETVKLIKAMPSMMVTDQNRSETEMTLIITDVSEFGITMVADSAVTTEYALASGVITSQILTGVQKLQLIPSLNAGISIWGLGEVEIERKIIPADVWLSDYIKRNNDSQNIAEFADKITHELQQVAGHIEEPMGLHLSGYVERDGQRTPTVYHIRNNDGDAIRDYTLHEFVSGLELEPGRLSGGDIFTLRNGDYGPYAILSNSVLKVLSTIADLEKLEIPHRSLSGRLAFHTAWVRFVSDLYASANVPQTIGGGITSIGIPPEGEIIYRSSK